MVACRADCSAGSATFTTVPSINAMLEPRIVAARIQGPFVVTGGLHEPARIAASSQGGLAMLAIVHSPPSADVTASGHFSGIQEPRCPYREAGGLLPALSRRVSRFRSIGEDHSETR